MAENTKIDYADHTWSPWLGCSPVHTGCKNCYAQTYFDRFGIDCSKVRRKTTESYWRRLSIWNQLARESNVRERVFLSLCDPFEKWQGPIVNAKGDAICVKLPPGVGSHDTDPIDMADIRQDMFSLFGKAQNLNYMLFTKRTENILPMWPRDLRESGERDEPFPVHMPNVWLVYSASDQETLEAGLPHLLECRDLVPVLGLSLEPLVGPIKIPLFDTMITDNREPAFGGPGYGTPNGIRPNLISWVAVGGESGPNARPCALEWIDDIVRQCKAAGVACFVKQLGSNSVTENANLWSILDDVKRYGNTASGCHVPIKHPKGGDPLEWPESLRVQQYPEVVA